MSLVYYFFWDTVYYYVYSTMKTEDTETLGRQRAKPSKIKAQ